MNTYIAEGLIRERQQTIASNAEAARLIAEATSRSSKLSASKPSPSKPSASASPASRSARTAPDGASDPRSVEPESQLVHGFVGHTRSVGKSVHGCFSWLAAAQL